MTENMLQDITILYVEDDQAIKQNTIVTLELVNATIIDAKDGQDGLDKFKEHIDEIDIIVTDLSMPIMDGLEMIEQIKEIKDDIPILITTAHQDLSYLKRAIELGVTSYILKPIDIRNIIKSIVKAMEPVNLKRELIKKNQELIELNNSLEEKVKQRTLELEILASTDPLTGINNRRNFFKLAKELFNTSKQKVFSIILDIDNFKKINDTYGHSVGDEVLVLVASTIKNCLNENDIFGRIGGEEFAIVYDTDNQCHLNKSEHIRKSIEDLKYKDLKLTISIGISQKKDTDSNVDSILNRADKAMYEAKGQGRNKAIFRDS